jgi:predicted metalloprotease with PDZ domain
MGTKNNLILALGLLLAGRVLAQPEAAPPTAMIPAPEDSAYPGTLTLSVDATDIARHIFTIHETIPVTSGPLTLLFPKWLPGEHAPTGPIAQLAGLVINADGKRLDWQRDPVEMTAFHVKIPSGVTRIDIDLQRLAMSDDKFGGTVVTSNIEAVKWSSLSLYPAGYAVSRIQIRPDVTLPHGWTYVSGLDGAKASGDKVSFAVTSYETLVDSPLYAGRYGRQFDLDPGAKIPVRLTAFADHEEDLDARPEQIEAHRALVAQAYKLFGSRHYDHYDFMLALNERMSDLGIEHHRSSEDGYSARYFADWEGVFYDHDLLAHEFTHSWNGKFRRPADLWTADYNQPMRDSLLWVYEGQTHYWGNVLAARSGLLSKAQFLEKLAVEASHMDLQAGRTWRSLQDTTNGEILDLRGQHTYNNWMRGLDYYVEGALIWLDADTLIREKSKGAKSLDDFARSFFGVHDGQMTPETYRFDDVVAGLNSVFPYDWAAFLRSRLDGHGPGGPLDGLLRGGYRLTYNDQTNIALAALDSDEKTVNLSYSLGLVIGHDNAVNDVAWNSPAFRAGVVPGSQLIAVNSYAADGSAADLLRTAIIAAEKSGSGPIELLIKADDRYRMVWIDYHGGLHYPHLEALGEGALLDKIAEPKE